MIELIVIIALILSIGYTIFLTDFKITDIFITIIVLVVIFFGAISLLLNIAGTIIVITGLALYLLFKNIDY